MRRSIVMIFERIGGFWMISLFYFIAMALLGDLIWLTNYLFGIYPDFITKNLNETELAYFGLVIFLLILFSIIGYLHFRSPAIVKLKLSISKRNGNGGKINAVAVSDVHLGDLINRKRLEKYVEMINGCNPDIILIAGDLFDRNMESVRKQNMQEVLKKLKSKYGTYAILGNHEYIGKTNEAIKIIQESEIKLLRDSFEVIDDLFVLAGRDDLMNKNRKPLSSVIENCNPSLPLIVMDHQPVRLSDAVENKVDLQISGHTHNGQIVPFNYVVSLFYEMVYGYKKKENTHFYVSSGLGLWGAPIRLGTKSEIVCFEIDFI